MRLQSFGVIFVIIIVPLILVLSYYLSLQIKTITKQNEYDSELLGATYDAMSAFEINTANEDLSTVSDSLRTIIEASCNVFMNTLATNLGMSNASKTYVEPFVPAILYTLYDGYYIYAPTKVPEILTDENGRAVSVGDVGVTVNGTKYNYNKDDPTIQHGLLYTDLNDNQKEDYGKQLFYDNSNYGYTTDVNNAKMKVKNVLKSYMPYSAKYVKTDGRNININVIYTLDNYVTIEGNIDGVYYTKSGYLIPTKASNGTDSSIKLASGTNASVSNPTPKTEAQGDDLFSFSQSAEKAVGDNYPNAKSYTDARNYIKEGNKVILELEDGIRYEVGNNPVTIEVTDGSITEQKTVTYIYKEFKDARNTTDEDNNYNYYDYDMLKDRMISLNNIYDEAINMYNTVPLKDENNSNDANEIYDFFKKYASEGLLEDGCFTKETVDDVERATSFNGGNVRNAITTFIERVINDKLRDMQYTLDEVSAVDYYVESYIFSKWVEDTLGGDNGIKESDLVEIAGEKISTINGSEAVLYDFSTKTTTNVFDVNGITKEGEYEIAIDSPFYTHKLNVIRNSIQYNLNLAMTTYNNNSAYVFEYAMPILNDAEWERILTNISVVSFMQGYSCGLKTYNNYKIVTSTNNELTVTPENIYYVKKGEFNNGNSKYHQIYCPELYEQDGGNDEYISFKSKEVKYDKIQSRTSSRYKYDHKNLACYECVNSGNYTRIDIFNPPDKDPGGAQIDNDKIKNLKKAYYLSVGKERNNLYKMNAFSNSQGYEIIYLNGTSNGSKLGLDKIRSIEVTIKPLVFVTGSPTENLKCNISNESIDDSGNVPEEKRINSDTVRINYSADISTFEINVVPNPNTLKNLLVNIDNNIKFINVDEKTNLSVEGKGISMIPGHDITSGIKSQILCVKVIYK